MKLPRYSLLFVFSLVAFFAIAFSWKSILSMYNGFVGKTNVTNEFENLNSFPKNMNVRSQDKKWYMSGFNAVVTGYENINGYSIMKIMYRTGEKETLYSKVLLKIPEEYFTNAVAEYNLALGFDTVSLRNQFVSNYSVFEKFEDQGFRITPIRYEKIEDLQNAVPVNSKISFLIMNSFPSKVDRANCIKDVGIEECIIADLTEIFTPDLNKFWQEKSLNENSVLVPFGIYKSELLDK